MAILTREILAKARLLYRFLNFGLDESHGRGAQWRSVFLDPVAWLRLADHAEVERSAALAALLQQDSLLL
jgi:hypothetical protein